MACYVITPKTGASVIIAGFGDEIEPGLFRCHLDDGQRERIARFAEEIEPCDEQSPRIGRPPGQRNPPGHQAGRPPLANEPTESHSITAPASVWRAIEKAGGGNRSRGLRKLIAGTTPAERKKS